MKPLRHVETVDPQDFSRSKEVKSAPPHHWKIPDLEAAVAYVDYLDMLPLPDRELIVSDLLHSIEGTGPIALKRGYPDVEERRFGICGSSTPWIVYHSKQLDQKLLELTKAWQQHALQRGVASGEKIYRWCSDFRFITLGFQRLVAEIIYGDYSDHWLTERPTPHIEELLMDPSRLRGLVAEWYRDNRRELRIAAIGDIDPVS